MEAERTRSGQSGRPVPLPKDYQPQYTRDSNPCEVDYGMSDSNQTTKVEAYPCPATPPVQCNASHQLQDTLDLIREVTRDPANPESYEMLKRLANGEPVQRSAPADKNASSKKKENEFGDSLAKNVRSGYRPVGSGLVWTV
ncbi:hypothetical protein AGDE_08765 [Angomonas deanei]|uniref:Uncharacterized protein n=1 Tax=Angomonas deanei TaxID=59799 RepID=A0A7G2CBV9_9TRYP|nr:hypothetical protein AGDE_08765 [Angomonas deanei]CAD2216414.1 hypothetical protein, conserved [Angomonas deanei]|eukprot:EPY32293.1 hypothetical protein AGDE_08765 [Angomonas deanei]